MGLGIAVLFVLVGLLLRPGPWDGWLLVGLGATIGVLACVLHVRRHRS